MKPLLFTFFAIAALTVAGQNFPQLAVERTGPQSLRLAWTNSASGFALERSSSLGAAELWESVTTTPTEQNNQFSSIP